MYILNQADSYKLKSRLRAFQGLPFEFSKHRASASLVSRFQNPKNSNRISIALKKGVTLLLLFLLYLYRTFLSPHFGGACRFSPSCSHYAEILLSSPKQSLLRTIWLTLKRLSKCHFFGPFGLDEPVLDKRNDQKESFQEGDL